MSGGYDSGDEVNTELIQKNNRKVLDARIENGTVHTNGLATNGVGSPDIVEKSRWHSLKWKSALSHIGLLISLSIYCGVGGVVSLNF